MSVKKSRKLSDVQKLVIRLVSRMESCYNGALWGKEGKIAKNLIETHGLEFMNWLPKPEGYRVVSMLWFFTDTGKSYLNEKKFEFNKVSASTFEPQPEITLTDKSQDILIKNNKPKTLKEFIYGQKN